MGYIEAGVAASSLREGNKYMVSRIAQYVERWGLTQESMARIHLRLRFTLNIQDDERTEERQTS